MTLLVLAAAQFEAQKTLDLLRQRKISYDFFEIGIGPLNAAKNFYSLEKKCLGKKMVVFLSLQAEAGSLL